MANYISTLSGKRIYLDNPHPSDFRIEDIAAGLAKECRFNGQCQGFYSVAQHSVLLSRLLPDDLALVGLLHDAPEAYLRDVSRPVKYYNGMDTYRDLHFKFWQAIAFKFHIPAMLDERIEAADNAMLAAEKRDLMPEHMHDEWPVLQGVEPAPYNLAASNQVTPYNPATQQRALDWEAAYWVFMGRYDELTGEAAVPQPVLEIDSHNDDSETCEATRDGECYWTKCPQVRDGEPWKTGRQCPLDKSEEETGLMPEYGADKFDDDCKDIQLTKPWPRR